MGVSGEFQAYIHPASAFAVFSLGRYSNFEASFPSTKSLPRLIGRPLGFSARPNSRSREVKAVIIYPRISTNTIDDMDNARSENDFVGRLSDLSAFIG